MRRGTGLSWAAVAVAVIALSVCCCEARLYRRDWKGTLAEGLSFLHSFTYTVPHDDPTELWFEHQKLDHFDQSNTKEWKQRYFVNDTFWTSPSGPIFLMLGGEGPESSSSVTGHFLITQQAQKFGALVVALEHRFYGKSQPFADTSTHNLKYLSSQQALADAVSFRAFLMDKYQISKSSKWIVFGGSYSGSLSAWLRAKYPHLFYGSIAASAPVFAKLEFEEYFEVVAASLGESCTKRLKSASDTIVSLLSYSRPYLENLFSACSPIQSDDDVATFLSSLTDPIATVVQYNRDNTQYVPFDITKLCSILESDIDPVKAWANLTSVWHSFTKTNCTLTSYKQYINELRDTSLGDTAGRCWTYQTCVEFGYYQTGKSDKQPFSSLISLDWFLQQCEDIFGLPLVPDINATNACYGGRDVVTSNTVFSNGSIDPWHALGITTPSSSSPSASVIYIDGTAHCADLYWPRSIDLSSLETARQKELLVLGKWLSN